MWFSALTLALVITQPSTDDVVARAIATLDKDPPIEALQRAALEYFRVQGDDISGYRSAARLKALLPSVNGSYAQDDSRSLRLSTDRAQFNQPFDETPQVTDSSDGLGRVYSASASWDLGLLIFNPSELEAYSLVGIQEDLLKEVTRLYYTRQQNILAMILDPPTDVRAKAALILRTRELESMLNALTGGAFARLKKGKAD